MAPGARLDGLDVHVLVKIKVGRDPGADPDRLAAVREVVGDGVRLMVDANGAFTPARALAAIHWGVTWVEEPVSSDDHAGLRRVRGGAPPGAETPPANTAELKRADAGRYAA